MSDAIKEVASISVWVDKDPLNRNPDEQDPNFRSLCQCDVYDDGKRCEGSPTFHVHFDGNGCEDSIGRFLCEKHIDQLRRYVNQNLRVPGDLKPDEGRWQPIATFNEGPIVAGGSGTFDLWVEVGGCFWSQDGFDRYRIVDCGLDEEGNYYHIGEDQDKWVIAPERITHWMRVGSPERES